MEHADNAPAGFRRWLGLGLYLASPLVAAAIWLAGIFLYARMGWTPDWFGWVTGVALAVGGILVAVGRRLRSRGAARVLAADRRAPVLFLRSFMQDRTSLFASDTAEARLAAALREVGPVIAVGRPREGLAPEGAERVYYPNEEWRRRVEDDISKARILVIGAGTTPNLLWEIATASRLAAPERTLLALPERTPLGGLPLVGKKLTASSDRAYADFRTLLLGVLPHPLPESSGNASFVAFDADWRPRLLSPPRWKPYNLSHVVRIRETIRPWCESLGIALGRRRRIAAAIGYSLALGLLFAGALVILATMALSP